MARRYSILTLANNANAAAVETARAALTEASGHPVIGGGRVSFHARGVGEAISGGDLIGFARVPTTLNNDRSISGFTWVRWAGGDYSLANIASNEGVVTAPLDVPIGATAVISLPLALTRTAADGGSTELTAMTLGIFSQAQDTFR